MIKRPFTTTHCIFKHRVFNVIKAKASLQCKLSGKHNVSFKHLLKYFFYIGAAFVLQACGGEDSQQIPTTASLSVSPSEVSWDIAPTADEQCVVNNNIYQDHAFVVTLSDNSAAIGNIDLTVFATLAGNTFSGVSVVNVYDDINHNGVIDAADPLVSGIGSQSFVTRLNQQGFKMLLVRVNVSCPYKGTLDLFASGASQSLSIEVTQQENDDNNEEEDVDNE